MSSVSVVIPVYDNWQGCHKLLYDLYQNCSLIEEVIIVNDASPSPDVMKGLTWWKSTNMLPLEIIDLKENLGFLRASNLGLKMAVEDRLILISTDVRVHKDILKETLADDDLQGGRLLDWDTGWNTFDGIVYPYVEGWILDTWKSNWEQLGYFDERFVPCDMEDIDLSTSARKMGMTLTTYPEGYVSHGGGHSIKYGEEREKITKANKEKFREKWS